MKHVVLSLLFLSALIYYPQVDATEPQTSNRTYKIVSNGDYFVLLNTQTGATWYWDVTERPKKWHPVPFESGDFYPTH